MIIIDSYRFSSVPPTSAEYPPVGMSSASTLISGQSYGNGTYTASGSSSLSGDGLVPFKVFDKVVNLGSSIWANGTQGDYLNSTGLYVKSPPITTSGVDGTPSSFDGEWIQLQLPSSIVLQSYVLFPRPDSSIGQMINSWRLLGSNNGTSWTLLDSQSNVSNWTLGVSKTYTITNSSAFTYYRIVIISININSGGFASLCEWRLFGY